MYPRKLYPWLKEHLSKKQMTVITGMRRTGKTTLLKQLLADISSHNKIYIDMERIDNREIFSEKNHEADYVKLSRLTGISRLTVYNYMEFLEKTYIIRRIPVLAKNPDREIVKAQKLYFYDNGILNLLADVSSGAKFENALFMQLHHWGKLSYYALKTGREIDFILDQRLTLEAKESPTKLDKEALSKLADRAGIKAFRLIGRYPIPHFKDYIWGGEIR